MRLERGSELLGVLLAYLSKLERNNTPIVHKRVHSLVLNRLAGPRVKKLVHLFFNARN
ncbi:hypothetical protein PR002_g9578 [Phytophthora rubi]|uniref:Uncharacterized protein n=1 Tax=Phytophthora rubi TaxID=129364 RepID=A0A6A3MGT0_9STRA|nr:hypothetical protein PR002_g9578 [Phytophthora rubi]